jgi:hypothetical protein
MSTENRVIAPSCICLESMNQPPAADEFNRVVPKNTATALGDLA